MTRTFTRLRFIFLGAFAILTAAAWGYEFLYVRPEKACLASGDWWDAGSRQCGHVVFVPDLTGKPLPPGVKAHRPLGAPPPVTLGAQAG